MKFENTEVFNFEGAFRGMRNPMKSWSKSDSYCIGESFVLGPNDLDLAQRLIRGGTEHRKFLRQILVSVDITAPLYFWKEADTYKVGTTANSTSTMHQLAKFPITLDCFELSPEIRKCLDGYTSEEKAHKGADLWINFIQELESLRIKYLETNDIFYWKQLVQLLPNAWLQTRTITMNYENLYNMYIQRRRHKLTEWKTDFCAWTLQLPYFQDLFEVPDMELDKR